MLQYAVILLLFASVTLCHSSCCEEEIRAKALLETASDLISKAKSIIPTCPENEACVKENLDCADVLRSGHNESGIYNITLVNRLFYNKQLEVYCDMETDGGGWTIIQRRGDFQKKEDYFFKDWKSYKEGFGDIKEDFWLGNDNIFALTNQKLYSVRFDLQDVGLNKKYAHYDTFWIDNEENKYILYIANYTGDAGDSMILEGRYNHNKQKFSTYDQDNDNSNDTSCAEKYKGGWWYNSCQRANLNGLYRKGKYGGTANGIHWATWNDEVESWSNTTHESLETTEIKIRPKSFRFSDATANTPM